MHDSISEYNLHRPQIWISQKNLKEKNQPDPIQTLAHQQV